MAAPRRVLVVDDSNMIVKQLSKILAESGRYEVIGDASDGLVAMKRYRELKPDVVCMDVVMPNYDGLKALAMLLKLDPQAKIVVISSLGGTADVVTQALQQGAKNVIAKPFEPQKVLDVLDAV